MNNAELLFHQERNARAKRILNSMRQAVDDSRRRNTKGSPYPNADYDTNFGSDGRLLIEFKGVKPGWASSIIPSVVKEKSFLATFQGL